MSPRPSTIEGAIPPALEGAVAERLEKAAQEAIVRRIWERDGTVWA
ncbi:MAG: hypothetical protein QOE28_2179, partial [Solirubrobacteraceae bacterium]|nr:hypothetical protein [Solirubrobacteraceae bacterium]